jgi:hypothetical protein
MVILMPRNTHRKGVKARHRRITMRSKIIEFATELFPQADVVTALEMLIVATSVTIDDIIFAEEDAEDPLLLNSSDGTDDCYWDYVY